MLGGLYRSKKKYAESIAVYSKALARIAKPRARHWNLFFGRGVAYERNKEWTKGEPDFLKALELLPVSVRRRARNTNAPRCSIISPIPGSIRA
jgi:tetratricopeptide (TPR) repeat protein